jgi:hypothetical protein
VANGHSPDGTAGGIVHSAAILVAASLLLWPAFWNVYPLVYSDTGTYLTQAIHRYLGWDRPVFYSLFLYALHLQRTLWPPIVAQAILAAWLLHLLRRVLLPGGSAWLLPVLAAFLAALTSLPFVVSQLMPDVFTALLVIAMALAILAPERLSSAEAWLLVPLTGFMIVAHQSHVALSFILLLCLLPFRHALGAKITPGRARGWLWRAVLPLPLACLALIAVNLIGHGRASLSPFGNVFLLARLIYDGPGRVALEQHCPQSGWRLCSALGRLPPTSDDFLWHANSPMAELGGAKILSAEANAIILTAIRESPFAVLRGAAANAAAQLARFATGDGLRPWPDTVTPAIVRDFPKAEAAAYAAARQQRGDRPPQASSDGSFLPAPFIELHNVAAGAGICSAFLVLIQGLRRGHIAAGFAAGALLAVLANAVITGALSGPLDRYQSRIVWLPLAVTFLAFPTLSLRRPPVLRLALPPHALLPFV